LQTGELARGQGRADAAAMKRVLLVHWNAEEAKERAMRLRAAGYAVDCHTEESGGEPFRSVRKTPPDAFVVDLGRLPSHGRALGVWLRQQKTTRRVPIVFIEGDPDKTQATRKIIPDATYTDWRRIRGALRRAIERPPRDPVVPGTMESYSGTPLPKKLGVKSGSVLALLGAPGGFEKTLGRLPDGVRVKKQARGSADVIVLFANSLSDLERRFPGAAGSLVQGGRLWIAWPKKASGVATDLTQTAVRRYGLDAGLVDYKISAIDDTWSGLCFTQRRTKRRGR
jgi:CheY-like chemotaxis protein